MATKSLPRTLRISILRTKDTALLEAIPLGNHTLNAAYRDVLNNQILVEQQARYLHKTDPLKTAVLSYRASYSLQQACQAKPGKQADKTVFLRKSRYQLKQINTVTRAKTPMEPYGRSLCRVTTYSTSYRSSHHAPLAALLPSCNLDHDGHLLLVSRCCPGSLANQYQRRHARCNSGKQTHPDSLLGPRMPTLPAIGKNGFPAS